MSAACKRALWSVLLGAVCLLPGPLLAQDFADKVKAAFLYNFARFISWPDEKLSGSDPLQLCVVGNAEFGVALAASLAGKRSGPHPLQARDVGADEPLTDCHAAYLSADGFQALSAEQRAQLAQHNVLTVHEGAAAVAGGVIRFYLENRRVRFEINRRAADQAGLQVSSKLLSVAKIADS